MTSSVISRSSAARLSATEPVERSPTDACRRAAASEPGPMLNSTLPGPPPPIPLHRRGPHKMGGFSIKRFGRRRTSHASVGEPLDMSRFGGKEPSAALLREITDEVMSAVRDEVAWCAASRPRRSSSSRR